MTIMIAKTTQNTKSRVTFADYLTYFDGSDTKYELVDGELVAMSLATGKHGGITKFLERDLDGEIERTGLPWIALQGIVGVRCPRGIGLDTVRIPDVVVMQRNDWQALQEREAVIDFDLSAPLLVIEVISPSTKNVDYRAKRTEYAARDIPEYWIIDPLEAKVTVLINSDGWYDITEFFDSDRIISPTFPELQLTPLTIFSI
ncbi:MULTISPECIES: Uma2 family endonuclease [Pseudanabaena]|jgi:Uma2 family endonuclease|uniref:Uma2 family endonuclease n=1 Tax=Pseudanabaena TaxID=1152 RepID=UPI00247A1C2C|nr:MULTISPECIES: Uma2 family endonuclease [Pseudanabaena]MEA5487612.1 Uma2 family endonuclease [Pseudanabaena sp. CCNP1317]WGS75449.1 Uma2 family endonuclease [Pseudanabaena galeata CCNP1313]